MIEKSGGGESMALYHGKRGLFRLWDKLMYILLVVTLMSFR